MTAEKTLGEVEDPKEKGILVGESIVEEYGDSSPLLGKKGNSAKDSLESTNAHGKPPTSLQLWCIRMLWFTIGLTRPFAGVASRFYMVEDLKASPHTQAIIGVLSGFAWNLKLPVAFTSDVVPIFGYRRKPYLYFGLCLYVLCHFLLAFLTPTLATAASCMCLTTVGMMMTGVMCDTLIVENMRYETEEKRGKLQTECWVLMTLAGIGGTLAGGYIFEVNGMSNQKVFFIHAVLHIALVFPFAIMLEEEKYYGEGEAAPPASARVKQRWGEMWNALQTNQVWQPTLFVFLFGIFPNPGTAMTNFFINELGFTETELAYIAVVASISGAIGMTMYYKFFKEFNWHAFFAIVICVASALSLTQLILVFHINRAWGIPDLVFALGDDAVVDVTNALLSMPILILVAAICPAGVESSLYALVTSVQMAGGSVGGTISAMLIESFGITLTNYDRLWQLIVVCAVAKLVILPLIPLLPHNLSIAGVSGERNWWGAAAVMSFLVFGISWALGESIYKLVQVS